MIIPEWMKEKEDYKSVSDRRRYLIRTVKSLSEILSRLSFQAGHEKEHALPAILKLILTIALMILISVTNNRLILMGIFALVLLYLSTWPAKDILSVLKVSLMIAVFTGILLTPAAIFGMSSGANLIRLVLKAFLCLTILSLFNHTTQWNHITGALKKMHVPGIMIFILDVTLKYIVMLGVFLRDVLTAVDVRSVGRDRNKYDSVGGAMGVTLMRGAELNKLMYEAMQCRGFTGDYDNYSGEVN